jgi:D-glycero-alpha-D-manno-heptose-7-phosphate kinase
VLNIAVEPGVEVTAAVRPSETGSPHVAIDAADYGDHYRYPADAPVGRHPLLEAAVAEAGLPAGVDLELAVRSAVPPGAGAGTSAAVTVAVIGALDHLGSGRLRAPIELAAAAHRVETVRLGRQSGVQDQLASAHGGISFITIDRYPDAAVERLPIAPEVAAELDRRLLLVYLGRSHDSSAVHRQVITELEASPSDADVRLEPLRAAAREARQALLLGDVEGLGAAMRLSTDGQRRLHPALVSSAADRVFEIAAAAGASGWKANGAGGDGGSVTVLCGAADERRRLAALVTDDARGFAVLPAQLATEGATAEAVGGR